MGFCFQLLLSLILYSVFSVPTLDDVGGHEGGGVVVALEVARGEVTLDLEAEEVPGGCYDMRICTIGMKM